MFIIGSNMMVCYGRIICNIGFGMGICLCLLYFGVFVTVEGKKPGKNEGENAPRAHIPPVINKFLKHLCPADYHEDYPPTKAFYGPIEVEDEFKPVNRTNKIKPWVQLMVHPFYVTSMSMKEMDFTVYADFKVTWEDSRLGGIDSNTNPKALKKLRGLDISKFIKVAEQTSTSPAIASIKLWLPDIKFSNSRGASNILISPQQSLADIKVRINPWIQRLSVSYRLSNHFFCDYDFKKYPFDEQQCTIQLNFEHSGPYHLVKWSTKVLIDDISKIRVPPEYELSSLTVSRCGNTSTDEDHLIECAEYIFSFKRTYAQHIMLLFVPSILIVSLSWISFWLDASAAPPRVALGLTSLLTLATQFNNAQKDLPSVADIKAVDIWMFACMLMVFTTLVEFAIVNYSNATKIKPTPPQKEPEANLPPLPQPKYVYSVSEKAPILTNNFLKDLKKEKPSKKRRPKIVCCFSEGKGHTIDKLSRIIFPMTFLIFNIVFWTYFTL